MAQASEPPLTPETQEDIAVHHYAIHQMFHKELLPLRNVREVDLKNLGSVARFIATVNPSISPPEPDMPRQPIKLSSIVARYANELFIAEFMHYPDSPDVQSWRYALVRKVGQLITAHIDRIGGLTFHASHAEIVVWVQKSLDPATQAKEKSNTPVDSRRLRPLLPRSSSAPPDPITPVSGRMQWTADPKLQPEKMMTSSPMPADRAGIRRAFVQPKLDDLGITPSGWAAKAGLHPSIVYDYLKGISKPRPQTVKDLAQALGVKPAELPK
jgi:hypothetical protein